MTDKELNEAALKFAKPLSMRLESIKYTKDENGKVIPYNHDKMTGFIAGSDWKEKQLLEIAQDHTLEGYNVVRLDMDALAKRGITWGDKVKIIIIKKETE